MGLLLSAAIPGSLALARTNAAPDQAPLPTQAEPPKAIELIPRTMLMRARRRMASTAPSLHPTSRSIRPFQAEVEPNNTAATATALASNDGVVWGAVFPNGDLDYFSFTANAGDRVYAAVMTSFSSNGSTDSVLTLFASDGTTVVETDDNDGSLGSSSSTIAGANIVSGGAYFLQVKHFSATNHLRPLSPACQECRAAAPQPKLSPMTPRAPPTPCPPSVG
ncbi:PPC domain-containing protein [Candidatus Amarobacter glycogenicus]|uniref:PPC domain-containing protein n=1 Tax=Candidatus Amarobacter glycogenicus TaxID=3140699 RepID=UPI0031CC8F57